MGRGRAGRLDDVGAGVGQRVAQGGRQVRRGGRQRAPAARQDGPGRQARQCQPHLLGRLGRRAVAACRSAKGCIGSFARRLLSSPAGSEGAAWLCAAMWSAASGGRAQAATRGDTLCLF